MSSPRWEKTEILKTWSVPAFMHIAARIANIWRRFCMRWKQLADEILSGEMGGLSALTKDELMALLKI